MIDLRDLIVRPGEPVLPAWERLLDWAKQFRLHAGHGVRLNRTPNGTYIIADLPSPSWNHPFQVRLAEREVTVAFGTVNGLVPRIGGRTIDGLDENGRETEPPRLRIEGGPNEDLRSWIVIDVRTGGESGELDPSDPEAVVIRHARALRPDDKTIGRHPLAMLLWAANGRRLVRSRQITHFSLGHHYRAGDGDTPGRHFFWAT